MEQGMSRGTVLALVAMALSVIVLANDFSALNVALPQIEHDLDSDVSTVQWVINAYALVSEDKAGLAGGLILGAAGVGQAIGPLLGGGLTEISWRLLFFINVPIAATAVFVTWREIHQPPVAAEDERIDYLGIVTLSLTLVALLFGLDQATEWGWTDPRIIACFAAAVILFALFVPVERRAGRSAVIPADMVRNRDFIMACVVVLLMTGTFFGSLLYLPQFMQKELGYGPLEAGLGMLPMMLVFAVVSFAAGPLYSRLGAKLIVSVGAACMVVGAFLLSLIGDASGYGALVPGSIVIGLGLGLFYSSITTAGVTSVDSSRSSLAGGLVYMFQIGGGAIGLGLTTTVFTSASHDKLTSELSKLGTALSKAQQTAIDGLLAGTDTASQVAREVAPGRRRPRRLGA